MEAGNNQYMAGIQQVEEKLLDFLRTIETHQEKMFVSRLAEQNAQLQDVVGELFDGLKTDLADLFKLAPPERLQDFHEKFTKAIEHCADSYRFFLLFTGQESGMNFLKGRHELCRGKHLLYELRAELPVLQQYWVLLDALPSLAALETWTPGLEVPVGMMRKKREDPRSAYSLYVPENYTPQKQWPLIVCLHGGYSRDDDYILTWLRAAKSKGYMVLSPKSDRETWSAIRLPGIAPNPALDRRSIRMMLEEVWGTYAVDRSRVYLTGFSDGGIFTYVLGLAYADLFAGIAPVSGRIHPAADHFVRRGQGKDLPILIVHGGQDPIFPIEVTRQVRDVFVKLGYDVTYQELRDWGHAYPYSINETIVLPWFEGLGAKSKSPA